MKVGQVEFGLAGLAFSGSSPLLQVLHRPCGRGLVFDFGLAEGGFTWDLSG